MQAALKLMLILAIFFASTFILVKSTGIITIEKIEIWLNAAHNTAGAVTASVVVVLLFADLFIAIPTLTVTLLSGYFLGPVAGSFAAITGLSFAGIGGYSLSRRYGDGLLRFLIKTPDKRDEAIRNFRQHGTPVILLARATPILPEVAACMAGICGIPFPKFFTLWLISAIPYALIAAYAGSISTLENPMPAIYAAIGLTSFFWCAWLVFRTKLR